MTVRTARAGLTALVLVIFAGSAAATEPDLLRDLGSLTGFDQKAIRKLGDAPLVTKLEVSNARREAAFAGLIRIRTDGAGLKGALGDVDFAKTSDSYKGFGRFSKPARVGDVSSLGFPEDDIEILPDCVVGECKFKLDRQEIDALKTIDWKQKGAGDLFTKRFVGWVADYVDSYEQRGNAALIEYADKPKPVKVATTIESIAGQFSLFGHYSPSLVASLTAPPGSEDPGIDAKLVWALKDFGYRPTFAIEQVHFGPGEGLGGLQSVFAFNTLYANHYLAGRIQVGAVVDGEKAFGVPGHFILLVDRIEFDDDVNAIKRSLLGRGLLAETESRMLTFRQLADGS